MSDAKWNGEGLPPVGSEVDSLEGVALIKGYYGSQVWYQSQSGGDVVQMIEKAGFRPIRTTEDRAVEAMSHAYAHGDIDGGSFHGRICAIYATIRDGKIPGVKLEE